ncbi:hypothetical protein SUGI_0224130 [Cryptomeria japonica]|nr:hypothetical protein SUGI_0224130 [Cryptomeria japonica]
MTPCRGTFVRDLDFIRPHLKIPTLGFALGDHRYCTGTAGGPFGPISGCTSVVGFDPGYILLKLQTAQALPNSGNLTSTPDNKYLQD